MGPPVLIIMAGKGTVSRERRPISVSMMMELKSLMIAPISVTKGKEMIEKKQIQASLSTAT